MLQTPRSALAFVAALVLATLTFVEVARANGGTIQLEREPAGPYEITVLTSPSPISVGLADVSVMVEQAGTPNLVQAAEVTVAVAPVGSAGTTATFQATRDQATNKLFHAANVVVDRPGNWRIQVYVRGLLGEGAVSFQVPVAESALVDETLARALAGVPALLFIAWLARSELRARWRTRRLLDNAEGHLDSRFPPTRPE